MTMALSPGSWTVVEAPEEATLDPLISPAEVSEHTRGRIPVNARGLERVCRSVSGRIRDYCGWHIFPVLSIHDLIDGPGGTVLRLPTTYLRSIEAIRWRADALPAGSFRFSTLGFVEYDPYGTEGWPWPYVNGAGQFPTGFRVLDVEFTAGYQSTPDAVKGVALAMAARGGASPLGLTREQAGQVSLGFGSPEPLASELADLEPYRIIGV